jgi:hypothetical protein
VNRVLNAAKQVLACWETGDLAAAMRDLAEAIELAGPGVDSPPLEAPRTDPTQWETVTVRNTRTVLEELCCRVRAPRGTDFCSDKFLDAVWAAIEDSEYFIAFDSSRRSQEIEAVGSDPIEASFVYLGEGETSQGSVQARTYRGS